MAKLTSTAKGRAVSRYTSGKTVNKTGVEAYKLNDEASLVTGTLTCFFNEPKYYGDTSKDIINTARKLIETNPEFVAKLACFARNEFHMRTISQVLAAEVAHGAKGNPIIRKMVRRVIERPDDILNILSYYLDTFGERTKKVGKNTVSSNPITRGLRRGIADVFPRFDEYQLAKYKSTSDKVKLRDALKIARPCPDNDAQAALWKKLIENKLATPKTVATVLSAKGQSADTWEKLIMDKSLGYMATLRNLANFLENKISDAAVKNVVNYLKNEKAVMNSKQLPFRYFSAYREIENRGKKNPNVTAFMDALEDAIEISVKNLPRMSGTTFFMADQSGSMGTLLSTNSSVYLLDICNLLMAMAHGFCDKSIVGIYGTNFNTVVLSTRSGILANKEKITREGNRVGHSTNAYLGLEYLIKNKINVDRIVNLSDMQCYGGYSWGGPDLQTLLNKYKREINPKVWMHSIDLAGYGTTKVQGDRVNLIAGWSDKVLEYISLVEQGEGDLLERIRNYQI